VTDDPSAQLLIERDGSVATLTLNRPAQLNALSVSLRQDIVRAIRSLSADETVRAIILTGAGRAFSAGVDLREAGQSGFTLGAGVRDDIDMAAAFAACSKPVIGAVNGFAITGGFELALMCDMLIASEEARFADTHARVGLLPVWGLSQKLPRLIGAGRAKELSLTGNFLDARTAEQWGLVNRVVSAAELLPAARKIASDMASIEPAIAGAIRRLIDDGLDLPLPEALMLEIERGNRHNAAVTPEAAEAARTSVMARSRGQAGSQG
jgi:enoyl-CoA hydratase